jgi:hypothetical protein
VEWAKPQRDMKRTLSIALKCWHHHFNRSMRAAHEGLTTSIREPRGGEESSDNSHASTSSYCSRRSDHRVNPGARELTKIADLHSIVTNKRPQNVGILG